MSFSLQNAQKAIKSRMEPKIKSYSSEIRQGADPEPLFRNFLRETNEEWKNVVGEYVEKVETQRKKDKEDFEERLDAEKKAHQSQCSKNIILQRNFANHMLKMATLQRDHEQFQSMSIKTFLELSGQYGSVLDTLLDDHESLTSTNQDTDRELKRVLRERSTQIATEHNSELRDRLVQDVSCKLPNLTICTNRNNIMKEIEKIQLILDDLKSKFEFLTPDHWNDDDVSEIRNHKLELSINTSNLLQLLEESEARHTDEMRKNLAFTFNQRNAIRN